LEKYAYSFKGITTGDDPKFRRSFVEFPLIDHKVKFFQSSVFRRGFYGGSESVVLYESMTNPLQAGVYLRAASAMGFEGVLVSQMRDLLPVKFTGTPFDTNAGALIPKKLEHLPAIWCFCSSPDYNEAVRQIDQSLKVTNAT